MKRVLMVSPHFPPDTSAATHRVRLLAPHLPEFGWEPTVVTVDPRDYEGRLDRSLEALVPPHLRILRVRALRAAWTRPLGVGDLGLRSFQRLHRGCRRLLESEIIDCLFVTIFPSYPALLGPLLKRRFGIPFVLDYQDPWVGSWGLTAGPGANGRPDFKSRLSRMLATWLEPMTAGAADGITAVSQRTFEEVRERVAAARGKPCIELPLGGEPRDFDYLGSHPCENSALPYEEGHVHLAYVGTLLPLGFETLRSFLSALALLKAREPACFEKLRVHFVGTSNQTMGVRESVLPEARRFGVQGAIREVPERVDYLDAIDLLVRSHAILLLGSSEPHYTASKLYPALLARRPLLAIFHRESSVTSILERWRGSRWLRLVNYDDRDRAESRSEEIFEALRYFSTPLSCEGPGLPEDCTARYLARRLSDFLNRVVARKP